MPVKWPLSIPLRRSARRSERNGSSLFDIYCPNFGGHGLRNSHTVMAHVRLCSRATQASIRLAEPPSAIRRWSGAFRTVRNIAVRSKSKCPLFIASEMSGFGFGFTHIPAVVAVGKWESRALGGISKRGGKVGCLTFPRCVFSTALAAAFWVDLKATPWAL